MKRIQTVTSKHGRRTGVVVNIAYDSKVDSTALEKSVNEQHGVRAPLSKSVEVTVRHMPV